MGTDTCILLRSTGEVHGNNGGICVRIFRLHYYYPQIWEKGDQFFSILISQKFVERLIQSLRTKETHVFVF